MACFEREDFASGTSSRSTKLLWGGSRYLVQALVALFHYDLRLIRKPVVTIEAFLADFRMVLNCHRERTFLMSKQPHLTKWIPIAVPLTSWLICPHHLDIPWQPLDLLESSHCSSSFMTFYRGLTVLPLMS